MAKDKSKNQNVTDNSIASISNDAGTTPTANTPSSNGTGLGFKVDLSNRVKSSFGVQVYPWSTWLNGQQHLLVEGRDFVPKAKKTGNGLYPLVQHMYPKIATAARNAYKVCIVARGSTLDAETQKAIIALGHKPEKCLIVEARDMMADEVNAENAKREEEKVRAAELAAEKAAASATV